MGSRVSTPTDRALEYLATAETALLSYMARIGAAAEDSDDEEIEIPDMLPIFGAVLVNISRAAGVIEGSRE